MGEHHDLPPLGDYCEGCGEEKTYRKRTASSLVACCACFRKLPAWLREAFVSGCAPGAPVWEARLRTYLRWMREQALSPATAGTEERP